MPDPPFSASSASDRKGAKIQHDFFDFFFQYIFFKTSKESDISPQIIEFKNQED